MLDDGGFQVGFGIPRPFAQAEKLKHQRFLEQVLGLADDLAFSRQLVDAFIVATPGEGAWLGLSRRGQLPSQ